MDFKDLSGITKDEFFAQLTDEQKIAEMPYYQHYYILSIVKKDKKRWFIAFLIILFAFFATNAAWIIYEIRYEDQVYTYKVQQDSGEGGTNTYTDNIVRFIGGDDYGEADHQSNSQTPSSENKQ